MEQLPDRTITFVRALMGVVRFERDVFASIDQVIAVARGAASSTSLHRIHESSTERARTARATPARAVTRRPFSERSAR